MTYTVALIGARSGSSLKDKNIRPLAGHPLLAYSIKAAQKCRAIDRVIVSTDSAEYAAIALGYGADFIMQPSDTAQADSGDYPFIAHALDHIGVPSLPDLIAHLRPTTPLRDPTIISDAISAMKYNMPPATALRSVHEMSESAYKCFEIEHDMLKSVCNKSSWIDHVNAPRQRYTKTYQGNGYVDILSAAFIRQWSKEKRLHGYHVIPFITPPVIEVDTEHDFEMLELQAARHPEIVKALFDE